MLPGRKRSAFGSGVLMLAVVVGLTVAATQLTKPRDDARTTTGLWAPNAAIAFRARFEPAFDVPGFKWRAGVHSDYTGTSWAWGDVRRELVQANETIDVSSSEGGSVASDGRERLRISITPETFSGRTILGPNAVEKVDRAVEAVVVGDAGWYASIESTEPMGPYTITALMPVRPGSPGGMTEARLRAAGTAYSPELLARYTALPDGAMGPTSIRLLADVRAAVQSGRDPQNPYDLARTMETYLRDPGNFTYAEDIRGPIREHCGGVSTVECFAIIRRGYCEYSASTMTVLLRASGVPARIAYGFLPGDRDATANELVSSARAHWWVEVYFPGIGWFDFDPDGGLGEQQLLPPGSA